MVAIIGIIVQFRQKKRDDLAGKKFAVNVDRQELKRYLSWKRKNPKDKKKKKKKKPKKNETTTSDFSD